MRWGLAALIALGAQIIFSQALADNATEAAVRFRRGVELFKASKLREALEQFLVSHRLSPNPSAAHNVATCFELLGEYDDAFSSYSEYLTFELSEAERAQGQAALAKILPKVARLSVDSEPPGAAIYLDRENLGRYGRTPRTFAVPDGAHTILLRLLGYKTATATVALKKGEEVKLSVKLTRRTGRIDVRSEPKGARIRVGGPGEPVRGSTPTVLELPIGKKMVHLSLKGYRSETREVSVLANETALVAVTHVPLEAKRGRVRVLSNVPGALIEIDGREAGFSPTVISEPEGQHEVRVHHPGFRPWTGKVPIQSGAPVALEVTLEPQRQEVGRGPWPWVLLSTTAVAAVVGAGLGIRALVVGRQFENEPMMSRFNETRTLNAAADAMWGVTLLGAGATAALFVFGEDAIERDSIGILKRVKDGKLIDPR